MKKPRTIRQSVKLLPEAWEDLESIADSTGSHYRGIPSWRTLLRRIAEGDVVAREVKRKPK